ncbi:MAG: AsmA-like C-terminal region-containing protein [Reichenbachiella sp.]|uniref:AsmA-like C-terminal region-containing protein n=1 Tax=Reichenbachiella sp. TaxID=2184521 RepID=UPI003265A152
MKIFLKVLKLTTLVIAGTLLILIVAGWAMQDRIAKYALEELSKTFDSPLGTKKITFSLVKDFPKASIRFEGLWIGSYQWGENGEIQSIDTLAKVNNLFASVETMDLLDNIFTIRKVELQDGYVKYAIDENGVSNYDFLIGSDSTVSEDPGEPLELTAEDIMLSDLTLIYSDAQQKTRAKLLISQIEGSTVLKNPKTFAHITGDLQLSNLYVADTQLDRMQSTDLTVDITFRTDTLNIASLSMQTDDLSLASQGKLIFGNQMYVDVQTDVKASSLAALSKYAPDDLLSSYEISQVSGAIELNAALSGLIAEDQLPHYDVAVNLSNGSLKWLDYPLVYNIGVRATATNGSANSNKTTSVKISGIDADFSGNHINMNGHFSNLDELKYNLSSEIDIDLDASRALIPDSLAKEVGGKVNIQLATNGIAPDSINSEFVEAALKNTQAQISIDQLTLAKDDAIHLDDLSAQLNYIDHKISLENLNVYLPEYQLTLIDNKLELELNGDLLEPESTMLNIPSFHIRTKEGSINGSASIDGLKYVEFLIKSNLDLDLTDLKRFATDTQVTDMKGKVVASIQSSGKLDLDEIDSQIEPILYDQTNFNVTLKNVYLDMKDTLLNVQNLNGRILKKNHQIGFNDFSGVYQGIDFNIETTIIENVFNTVVRNQPGILKVDGTYRLGDLDYAVLGAFASSDDTGNKNESTSPPTAWNYDIKGRLIAKSFKYDNAMVRDIETSFDIQDTNDQLSGDLTVSSISYENTLVNGLSSNYLMNTSTNEVKGKLAIKDIYYEDAILNKISALYNVRDSVYTIDQLKFNAFGGKINTSAKVTLHKNEEMEIEMKNDIDHINMRRLMQEMKDFGQSELTHENFSGELTSDNLFLRMTMIGDSLVYNDLRMTGDLKFENGGIFQYPPVQDMAQYLKKIDNLDTMSFKTINTHFFLFKDAVYVPRTYVITSAFDVEAIGMQSFGEDYQYHIGVNLFQILGKKKKSSMDENVEVERKKMVRLKATGHQGEYKSGFDKEKERDAMLTKVKTREKILEFRFQPQRFNFDTGAEEL